jgi:Ca-activated chloride channel family protein
VTTRTHWLPLCGACLFFLAGLTHDRQLEARAQSDGDYKISLDVDLVLLDVTVMDHNGRFVFGLSPENFQVYEDEEPQKIKILRQHDAPATVGLVVDNSGSMQEKRARVAAASLAFAKSSNPADEMFVVNFDEKVSIGLPGGTDFTSDPEQLKRALTSTPAGGATALYDATVTALEHLGRSHHQKRALIIVSDGGDNSSHFNFRQTLELAHRSNAIIYTIGLLDEHGEQQNPSILRRLAKDTGGEVFFPEAVEEVLRISHRIATDIRNQYTLGYVPGNTEKQGYRRIRVTAAAAGYEDLTVRTRTGYYFAPSKNRHTASRLRGPGADAGSSKETLSN